MATLDIADIKDRAHKIFLYWHGINQIQIKVQTGNTDSYVENSSNEIENIFRDKIIYDGKDFDIAMTKLPAIGCHIELWIITRKI